MSGFETNELAALIISGASVLLAVFFLLSGSSSKGRQKDRRSHSLPSARSIRVRFEKLRGSKPNSFRILTQVPEMLDIVVLGLSAGLSFDMALSSYIKHYKNELSDGLSRSMLAWQIGSLSRVEALESMANSMQVPALKTFAHAVSESIELGAPLQASLERQAELVRAEERTQVEEQIEQAPVKMLIPLGILILPAMLLAILGPLLAAASLY